MLLGVHRPYAPRPEPTIDPPRYSPGVYSPRPRIAQQYSLPLRRSPTCPPCSYWALIGARVPPGYLPSLRYGIILRLRCLPGATRSQSDRIRLGWRAMDKQSELFGLTL